MQAPADSTPAPAPDRDWVDIVGTGLVIFAAVVAVLLFIGGWLWRSDRADARDAELRLACIENGWLWADDTCVPVTPAMPAPVEDF